VETYPAGWFHVAWSDEIAVGEVQPLRYFGLDLVAVRRSDGAVQVYDAFCPHLGAHLGFGGRLIGDDERLVCPFHEWEFDCDGRVARIPYANTENRSARLGTWEAVERWGLVFVWYDAAGAPPAWRIDDVDPHVAEPDAERVWSRASFDLTVHPQEIMENVVDGAHFVAIHRAKTYPDLEVLTDGHRLRSIAKQTMSSRSGEFDGMSDSRLWGLGLDVNVITGAVETLTIMTLTPVDATTLCARLTVSTPGSAEATQASLCRASREMVINVFVRDSSIWNNKRYEPSPRLASNEKGITTFRQWAQQFYASQRG
jgi:phenylpropionate dioxygenase-like ring-hydroxylating dioxygenase large terminal subunit